MLSFLKKKESLEDSGERMDINYYKMKYDKFDIYQKSHYKRYKYAMTLLNSEDVVGDFACGSGYGSMMLSENCSEVLGADINERVINVISEKYKRNKKVKFLIKNLLDLDYENLFDKIVSFETVEHFADVDIPKLFQIYYRAIKPGGELIFSTPYNQEKSDIAIKMGFHLTFYITETTIIDWMKTSGFEMIDFKFQNYQHHDLVDELNHKDFIICRAKKV